MVMIMEHPEQIRHNEPRRKTFDWLTEPDLYDLSTFQEFVVSLDWNKSPLGPISSWPVQLKQMVHLVMVDPTPAVIYWGDDSTIVYNEPYIALIGSKHPHLQGQDPKIGFAEIWNHFEALLTHQRESGKTTIEANAPLLLDRHGFLEETFFSWKFVPIIGPEGWVVGSHATVVEVTREILSDRRLSTVNTLSRTLSESRFITDLWKGIIAGLDGSRKDIPLALLYSVADIAKATKQTTQTQTKTLLTADPTVCVLEGCIGISQSHHLATNRLDLERDQTYLSPYLRKAVEQMSHVVFPLDAKTQELLSELEWPEHGIAPTTAVVCPIIPTNSGKILAFLVIALNPRRPYDDDYRGFLHLLTGQVTTPQLSAVILREEVERRALLARQEAIDRARLSKELSESETKFARFATRAPIGLAILTVEGHTLSTNELWRDYTQLTVDSQKVDWATVLVEGEAELVHEAWNTMVATRKPLAIHTRVKRPWRAPDLDVNGNVQWTETFLLLSLYPDFSEGNDGEALTVMSCVTDISVLKWSESQLRRKMDQAIELKKQQEKFIDMTSHEMRNPLSALIGCADEIITSINAYRVALRARGAKSAYTVGAYNDTKGVLAPDHLLDEAIDAADTIIYCGLHQKRIIDDILTLSRLDSSLLQISPEPSEPIHLVRSAIKMFEAETKRADILVELIEKSSLSALDVKWTLLDPSRVLQVLINLLTNAIKFTRTEPSRHIKITVGASLDPPSVANDFGVEFVQQGTDSVDETTKPEWGKGEVIYLSITVQDTGKGLTSTETKNLFHLFTQASPKTYTHYGGSGLGLYISRQLVQMQGGEIGVASESGKGSTFQFYVKTRRTSPALDVDTKKPDFQLMVRQDALREACGVETPSPQNGVESASVGSDTSRDPSPATKADRPKSMHILVVEDNLVNQKVLSKQLRKEGYIVNVANHGEEALDFIRRSTYWRSTGSSGKDAGERLNVVLMDLEMPVMDGITCVKKIRELQGLGMIRYHVPVIAVTANARKDQILRSLEAGMDDVATKPYRVQDLLRQIEKLVAKYTPKGL